MGRFVQRGRPHVRLISDKRLVFMEGKLSDAQALQDEGR